MKFRVLGFLEIRATDNRFVDIAQPQQKTLLSVLLLTRRT